MNSHDWSDCYPLHKVTSKVTSGVLNPDRDPIRSQKSSRFVGRTKRRSSLEDPMAAINGPPSTDSGSRTDVSESHQKPPGARRPQSENMVSIPSNGTDGTSFNGILHHRTNAYTIGSFGSRSTSNLEVQQSSPRPNSRSRNILGTSKAPTTSLRVPPGRTLASPLLNSKTAIFFHRRRPGIAFLVKSNIRPRNILHGAVTIQKAVNR